MALKSPIGADPPLANLRDRKKAATRKALHDAALRLFTDKGFGATSVDEIAAAADVSRSTFFRYFQSKEAVLFAQSDEAGEAFVALLRDRPQSEGPITAFEEALVQLTAVTGGDEQRDASRLLEGLFRNDPELKMRRMMEMERWSEAIAETFADRRRAAAPSLADSVATAACIATVEQIGREWREGDHEPTAVDAIRNGFTVLRSLSTEPSQEPVGSHR